MMANIELIDLTKHYRQGKELVRALDGTFALLTHDLDLAAQTDRMIRLKDGKVVSDQLRVAQPLTLTGVPVDEVAI